MKESDMFDPISNYLKKYYECTDVYGEIYNKDILGLKSNGENIIVEMKTTFNFKVIDQAIRSIGLAEYVFIATPKKKRNRSSFDNIEFAYQEILINYGIGVLEVDIENNYVMTRFPARRNERNKRRKNIRNYIKEHSHLNKGGLSGRDKKVTSYTVTIDAIKAYLAEQDDWVTLNDIVSNVTTHYSKKSEKASIRSTLQASWNSDWVEVKDIGRLKHFRLKTRPKD